MDKQELAAKTLVQGFGIIPCVKSIIAYGSFALGDYGEDSDIDLAILLDFQKFTHLDAIKLISCVKQVQRKYRVRLDPDFTFEEEIQLFNQGILLDGRAFSDIFMYNSQGKILFGQDFRQSLRVSRQLKHFGNIEFAIIEEHFKRWLLHNTDAKVVPNWIVSWTMTIAANIRGKVEIASREDTFTALEEFIPKIKNLSVYRKFKEGQKESDVLSPDNFLKLLKALRSNAGI